MPASSTPTASARRTRRAAARSPARPSATTEVRTGNLPRIVVTEIPYQVNKATLLEKIADLVEKKKIDAIRDLRDESSRDGMRIVIELKRGEDPAAVLAKLYQPTDLRSNFNVNFVALVDGAPRTIGLHGGAASTTSPTSARSSPAAPSTACARPASAPTSWRAC